MNTAKQNGISASVKGMVAKVLTVGFLAGAMVMFAPAKAQAQEVVVGVGAPYARHDFYERERLQEFHRHREFERERAYRRFEYDRFHHERFYR